MSNELLSSPFLATEKVTERAKAELDSHTPARGRPSDGSVVDAMYAINATELQHAEFDTKIAKAISDLDCRRDATGFAQADDDVGEAGKRVNVTVERMVKRSSKRSTRGGPDICDALPHYLRLHGFINSASVVAAAIRRGYNILYGSVDVPPQTKNCGDCWGPFMARVDLEKGTKTEEWVNWAMGHIADSYNWCYQCFGHTNVWHVGSLAALHFVFRHYNRRHGEDLLLYIFQARSTQGSPHRDALRRAVHQINHAMRSVSLASKKRRSPTPEMDLYVCALCLKVFFAELQGDKPADLRFDPASDPFPLVPAR